jgi:hypothetical protein
MPLGGEGFHLLRGFRRKLLQVIDLRAVTFGVKVDYPVKSTCAMLHITDGESVAGTLRESAIPGDVSIYGDLMYEGPAPGGVSAVSENMR